jgi:sodium pump decarboxylase gamma subunit
MDYSNLFVCLMGMGTVFFGLICLIVLTTLMGQIVGRGGTQQQAAPVAAPIITTPVTTAAAAQPDRQQLAAAVSAAIAEELGTDITGIRILSMKKV